MCDPSMMFLTEKHHDVQYAGLEELEMRLQKKVAEEEAVKTSQVNRRSRCLYDQDFVAR